MKKITYCKKCLYPDTKPNLFINDEGVVFCLRKLYK